MILDLSRKSRTALFCIVASIFSSQAFAGYYSKLTDDEKKIIDRGEQIVKFEKVINPDTKKEEIWPLAQVQQRVRATVEETVAVLMDYDHQCEYVHRVAASKVRPSSNPLACLADYRMKLPTMVDKFISPDYQLVNEVKDLGPEEGMLMSWNQVSGTSLRVLKGSSYIEPLPDGETLITYRNFYVPSTTNRVALFTLTTQPVMAAVRRGGGEGLQSIVDRIHDQKSKNTPLFQKEREKFREVFGR